MIDSLPDANIYTNEIATDSNMLRTMFSSLVSPRDEFAPHFAISCCCCVYSTAKCLVGARTSGHEGLQLEVFGGSAHSFNFSTGLSQQVEFWELNLAESTVWGKVLFPLAIERTTSNPWWARLQRARWQQTFRSQVLSSPDTERWPVTSCKSLFQRVSPLWWKTVLQMSLSWHCASG